MQIMSYSKYTPLLWTDEAPVPTNTHAMATHPNYQIKPRFAHLAFCLIRQGGSQTTRRACYDDPHGEHSNVKLIHAPTSCTGEWK